MSSTCVFWRCIWGLLTGGGLLLGVPSGGATYYVSLNGSDTNTGTLGQPWRTIQKGADSANSGDIVMVGPGDFGESVTTPRGGSNSFITFDGQGAATNAQFRISKPNIRVRNFTLRGLTTKYTGAIDLLLGGHHAYIDGNTIDCGYVDSVRAVNWDFGSRPPLDPDAASGVTVTNNLISRTYNTVCISLFGSNVLFVNNVMRDIRDADYFHVFGVSNTIRGNACIGFQDTTNSGNHMDCFQTFGNNGHASKHMIIDGNVFGYVFSPSDIDIAQVCQLEQNSDLEIHDWDVRNNIFFNLLKGECGVPCVRWHNNVFYQIWTNSSGGALILNWSADGRNNATNSQIINNVFLECGKGDYQSGWYSIGDNSSIVTNTWTVDYNYVGGTNWGAKNFGMPWSNQRWYEPHGINGGDPKFVDVLQHNFHLVSSSPLVDAGRNLSAFFSYDLEGTPRPVGTTFDIGPFESAPGLRPAAPTNLRVLGTQ